MNNRRVTLGMVGALLLALLMSTIVWASSQGRAPSRLPEPADSPATSLVSANIVSDTISYQGRLLDSSGNPVDGVRTIDFRLYTEPSGGTPLWSQSKGVTVEDGLFNANLSVDPAHFDGRPLWLGVQVVGDAQEMAPRQPLLPVPYALSLRPGAGISGTVGGTPTFNLLSDRIALHAETTSAADPRDPAILGINHGAGPGPGVEGHSVDGPGILGLSDSVVGVHGESIDGQGGFFTSTHNIGVVGNTLSNDPLDAAVVGVNLGMGRGIFGHSDHGAGIFGSSENGIGLFSSSLNEAGLESQSVHGAAAVFTSTHGPGVRIEGAGLEGLRILDTVWGDYIVAGSDADPDFRVSNVGDVFADGGYHCGLGPGGEPGTCVIQNTPADFAEMLPAQPGLESGDVLVIGPDGRLARSNQAYQSTVIGVYSTQPGYLGGGQHWGHEDYAPLAVVGIVPVKVSAEKGHIAPGDLLAASNTPGHAMKAGANPPVGTVIGKALEGFDGETGVILMLVMLQ
ncbi:MAG: hypothetical protein ACP5GX_08065 [Anaerolineae bacterium]